MPLKKLTGKEGKSFNLLYLPAWTIVTAVLILLVVVALSTYRNISREKKEMEESLLSEGLIIIRGIEAGIRADLPDGVPDVRRLKKLLDSFAQDPDVEAITIFDEEGSIVATSRPPGCGWKKIADAASLRQHLNKKDVVTRYHRGPEGADGFEIIHPFRPFTDSVSSTQIAGADEGPAAGRGTLRRWAADKMIILRIQLAAFESAHREDRRHNMLMAAILIVLGSGALYFIFIVHNYYLVNRTLGRMKSYTENVVESMADGLVAVDPEGRVVTLNRQALAILGSRREAVEGRQISEVLGEGMEGILNHAGGQALVRDREMDITGKPGGEIPLNVSVAPLKDEGGREMGAVILIRDLREIRELQEKLARSERLASLGRLAAGMAHEIRNPLSSIRGFAQFFLKRFSDRAEEHGYASVMVKEVDRLNRVITELLDFARPKEPRREPCRLEAIAEEAVKLLEQDPKALEIRVERDYEPDLPVVSADHDQISQVFINLLLNALHSTEKGGTIRISLGRSGPPAALEIVVADTGAGIPEEDLAKVFEPFFSRKPKGTGLGLAIVHQIVESHGGNIGVESKPGEGAAFRIRLPLESRFV